MISALTHTVTELNTLAQLDSTHFFKTEWTMVNMNLVAYESRYPKLGKAVSLIRKEAKLPNKPATHKHLTFILLNLLDALRVEKPLALAYPSSKVTIGLLPLEENPQKLTATLITVVDAMARAGYVVKLSGQTYMRQNPGSGRTYNRLLPTPKLVTEIFERFGLLTLPLGLLRVSNFVIVTEKQTNRYGEEAKHEVPLKVFRGETEKMLIKNSNSFLRAYNALLLSSDISLAQSQIQGSYSKIVYRKFCRRSLEYGGRLYGGFWQSLPSGKDGTVPSRRDILINGEQTVELDFKALHLNMLYAWKGLEPFVGDPYALPNWPREVVKKCILIALNCKTQGNQAVLKAIKDDGKLASYYAALKGGGYARLKAEFSTAHPAIADYLHADAGIRLQRQDSEIAMGVIHRMMNLDSLGFQPIPVLCVHDSFIVPVERAHELEMCMIGAFERIMRTRTSPIIEKVNR